VVAAPRAQIAHIFPTSAIFYYYYYYYFGGSANIKVQLCGLE
jgi:hypothetical protein